MTVFSESDPMGRSGWRGIRKRPHVGPVCSLSTYWLPRRFHPGGRDQQRCQGSRRLRRRLLVGAAKAASSRSRAWRHRVKRRRPPAPKPNCFENPDASRASWRCCTSKTTTLSGWPVTPTTRTRTLPSSLSLEIAWKARDAKRVLGGHGGFGKVGLFLLAPAPYRSSLTRASSEMMAKGAHTPFGVEGYRSHEYRKERTSVVVRFGVETTDAAGRLIVTPTKTRKPGQVGCGWAGTLREDGDLGDHSSSTRPPT